MSAARPDAAPPLFWRPEDVSAWSRWQRAQWPLARRAADTGRTLAGRARGLRPGVARPADDAGLLLALPAGDVHTLVALESLGPTQLAALAAPVAALDAATRAGVGWVLPVAAADGGVPAELPGQDALAVRSSAEPDLADRLSGLRRVLVAGEYLPSGRAAVRWARERGAEVGVVQHGLLAVSTPPVPRDVTLYAFTERDAAWWTQGRDDVRTVATGSALLERARRAAVDAPDTAASTGPGVFLGQLHGAELPRREFARAAEEYIRATGAAYRPHPAERDRLSRAQHARWEREGVVVDRSGVPLTATTGPVAAVFSTGILEAAQTGRPAWGVHPDPPRWLREFWDRYGIVRWRPGADVPPTPPLAAPTPDPAAAIAEDLWRNVS